MFYFINATLLPTIVTIQDHCHESTPLAFWMANCSELLNFAKLDVDLNPCTSPEPQESMADAVQKAYDHLVAYFKQELHSVMPAVLDLSTTDHEATSPCVHMLSGAMSTLRHCRVNAALTIQIFSQLFHYVNMYLFNWLVSREGGPYCTGRWGAALRRRLADVQAWAEKQGLEAAAECRLQTILQTAQLLQMQKTPDNFVPLCTSTSKLNSLQIRSILERYVPEMGEGTIDRNVLENLIKVSEEQVDEALRSDGHPVQLEEELDLQLPFLLPDDGYSAHVVRAIPNGLRDFVDPFLQRSICRMILQPWSSGVWTVHMTSGGGGEERRSQVGGYQSPTFAAAAPPPLHQHQRSGSISSVSASVAQPPPPGGPEVAHITLHKGDGGIGLSIIQAQGIGHTQSGIYVKNVVPGSCAARDGRLEAGDQLLKVNGQSLVGISQEVAAKIMGASGPTVHLEVAKRAVLYDGLATVVYQQSPDAARRGSSNTPDPITAGNRVRSVEHLHHHQQPQHQQLGSAVDSVHQQHQRYPSSGNVHYYQQPRTKTGAGPPPVQYHHKQQYHHQARSMSASNLKEDEPPQPQQQQRQHQHQHHQEEYYQNLAQYQTNPTTSTRRMSASDYGYQHYQNQLNQNHNQSQGQSQGQGQGQSQSQGQIHQQMVPHHRQHSTGALVSSSYASNQEYHRLPALEQQTNQQQFAVHRALTTTCASSAATTTDHQQHQLVLDSTYNQPSTNATNYYHHNHQQSGPPNFYQNLPCQMINGVARQVPWNPANRSGTPTGQQQQQQQHRPTTTTGQQQQQTSLRQRLGQEAAALAASAERNTWRTVEEEERERQVQAEVERLMLEEVSRLECKDQLTDEDQRRYRALKFELEYRRRLQHTLNQDGLEDDSPCI